MSADVVGGTLRVSHDASRLSAAAIAEAVNATGMRAWLDHDTASRISVRPGGAREAFLVASGAALAAGLALEWLDAPIAMTRALFAVSIAAGGWYWARRAWSAARLFALDINTLMLIAVAGAIAIGEWSEAAAVTFSRAGAVDRVAQHGAGPPRHQGPDGALAQRRPCAP